MIPTDGVVEYNQEKQNGYSTWKAKSAADREHEFTRFDVGLSIWLSIWYVGTSIEQSRLSISSIGIEQGHIGIEQSHIGIKVRAKSYRHQSRLSLSSIGIEQSHIGIEQGHIGIKVGLVGHIGIEQSHIGIKVGLVFQV
jgi:hypothetical protein